MNRWSTNRRSETNDTKVPCPACGEDTLKIRFSCLQTLFVCGKCGRRFALEELVPKIDDEQFSAIERLINHRLSDRI